MELGAPETVGGGSPNFHIIFLIQEIRGLQRPNARAR